MPNTTPDGAAAAADAVAVVVAVAAVAVADAAVVVVVTVVSIVVVVIVVGGGGVDGAGAAAGSDIESTLPSISASAACNMCGMGSIMPLPVLLELELLSILPSLFVLPLLLLLRPISITILSGCGVAINRCKFLGCAAAADM